MFSLDETTTDKLKQISDDLNTQSTALTDGFNIIEHELANLKLGVTAWAKEPIKDKGDTYLFGFCKIKGEWKLVCKKEQVQITTNFKHGSYGLLKTISWMPRHIRIIAASRLEDLVNQIIITAESFNDDIKTALSKIKSTTDGINA